MKIQQKIATVITMVANEKILGTNELFVCDKASHIDRLALLLRFNISKNNPIFFSLTKQSSNPLAKVHATVVTLSCFPLKFS